MRFPSFTPDWKYSPPLQKSAADLSEGGCDEVGGTRGAGEVVVSSGERWGLLQPVPCGTVLWVGRKLFHRPASGFFTQLVTTRAAWSCWGFLREERISPPVSLGTLRQGRAELAPLLAVGSPAAAAVSFCAPGLARGKGPALLVPAWMFYGVGLGLAGAGVCRVVVSAVGRVQPELLSVYRELLGRGGGWWGLPGTSRLVGKALFSLGGRAADGSWERYPFHLSSSLPLSRATPPSGTTASPQACGVASSSSWLCVAASTWSRPPSGRRGCWRGR